LLPIIREHLVAAPRIIRCPRGLTLELLPIVEDGLVGYEFLPNQATNSYLTIGCDDRGVPVCCANACTGPTRPADCAWRPSTDGRCRRGKGCGEQAPSARCHPDRLAVDRGSGVDRARLDVSAAAATLHRPR
jgi:hypothetical protein